MSVIIGIDISQASTGLARFGPPAVTWATVPCPKGKGLHDDQERAAKLLSALSHWTGVYPGGASTAPAGSLFAVLENFSFGPSQFGMRSVAMVTGIVRYWLWKNKIPFVLVSPQSLKKFVVGKASTKGAKVGKEIVNRELYARFGHKVDQNDAADAVVLAYIGAALKGIWTPQIEAQREVLAKLKLAEK